MIVQRSTSDNPIERLAQHDRIGVDMDGTLIGNPGQELLWEFIRKTHWTNCEPGKGKRFYIITFRDSLEAEDCRYYLDMVTHDHQRSLPPGSPSLFDLFDGVAHAPNAIHNAFEDAYAMAFLRPRTMEVRSRRALSPVELFKAQECIRLGLTALIDDCADIVREACVGHGIEFVDALELPLWVGR